MTTKEAQTATAQGEGLVWISHQRLIGLKDSARKLPLRAIRIKSLTGGSHLSRFRGQGMEFDEARLYLPGDDMRNFDWRVTARTGQPHTKVFREERERNVLVWVDYRAPMHFATEGVFKSVLASQAAALLAWSARYHGERLGGLVFSESGHKEIRPHSGDHTVLNLIGILADQAASKVKNSSRSQRVQSLHNALGRLRRVIRPGSLVFLISDFRDLGSQCNTHLSALAQHNDLVLFHIYDRLEAELPKAGRYLLTDGGVSLLVDSGSKETQLKHQEKFESHRHDLEQKCRRYRMHLLSCSTNQDPYTQLRLGLGDLGRRVR